MQLLKKIVILACVITLFIGCFTDFDDDITANSNIKSFIWKGMNLYYLYKDNVPDLANDRFSSDIDFQEYLNMFTSPEGLFESLIYDRQNVDKYSVILDDYIAFEQFLGGTSVSDGMDFDLRLVPGSDTDVFGFVRYVMPNTSAESQDWKEETYSTQLMVHN